MRQEQGFTKIGDTVHRVVVDLERGVTPPLLELELVGLDYDGRFATTEDHIPGFVSLEVDGRPKQIRIHHTMEFGTIFRSINTMLEAQARGVQFDPSQTNDPKERSYQEVASRNMYLEIFSRLQDMYPNLYNWAQVIATRPEIGIAAENEGQVKARVDYLLSAAYVAAAKIAEEVAEEKSETYDIKKLYSKIYPGPDN